MQLLQAVQPLRHKAKVLNVEAGIVMIVFIKSGDSNSNILIKNEKIFKAKGKGDIGDSFIIKYLVPE